MPSLPAADWAPHCLHIALLARLFVVAAALALAALAAAAAAAWVGRG